MENIGLSPVLYNAGSNKIHHHFFGCPICGNEVGGFTITGSGANDWGTHKDKFCSECGQKINWTNIHWEDIHRR